jgi:hypothetical protein
MLTSRSPEPCSVAPHLLHGHREPIAPYVPESPSFVPPTMFFLKKKPKNLEISRGRGKFDYHSNKKAHNKTGIRFFAELVLIVKSSVVRALRSFRLIAPGFFIHVFARLTGYKSGIKNGYAPCVQINTWPFYA